MNIASEATAAERDLRGSFSAAFCGNAVGFAKKSGQKYLSAEPDWRVKSLPLPAKYLAILLQQRRCIFADSGI